MNDNNRVVLITGSARRIGKATAERLHTAGWNVVIHYNSSAADAEQLRDYLNTIRPDSAKSSASMRVMYAPAAS